VHRMARRRERFHRRESSNRVGRGLARLRIEPLTGLVRTREVNRELAHLSDEALVALAARSEQLALAELYDRFGRPAYGLALRILRDEALAEDAVQEAFLALWRTAARFVPERGKASTWILTLVHRRAVDLVRREERRRTDALEHAPEPESHDAVEEEAWLRLQRERVQDALRKLPDQQREAIELAYYGGFTQSELAERLGQPLGTIKSRMFMGLGRLRELLGEPGMEMSWTSTT
jgi:RNA polymerase sigma-70 factor, ECF subfamily